MPRREPLSSSLHPLLVFVAAVALGFALLATSCGGGSEDATDPPSPADDGMPAETITTVDGAGTPAPGEPEDLINVVCPPQEPSEDDGYCELIEEIKADLTSGERPEILDNLVGRPVQCPDAGEVCGDAEGSVDVIQLTQDGEGREVALSTARDQVFALVNGTGAETSDDLGSGELSLYAIATGMTEVRDKAMVFTGISDEQGAGRFALMLIIADVEGEWRTVALSISTGEGAETFLAEVERRQSAGSFWKWQLARTIGQTGE